MKKKHLAGILVIMVASIAIIAFFILTPNVTEDSISQRFYKFEAQYQEKKTQGYDVTEAEEFAMNAKQAFNRKDYRTANKLVDRAFESLELAKIPVVSETVREDKERLSQVKVAILYERVTGGHYYLNRSIDDVINLLKETKTDFIFRGWWRKLPCPESPDTQSNFFPDTYIRECIKRGNTYEHLRDAIASIKEDIPNTIFCGAVSCQWVNKIEKDPITQETFDMDETWGMALDPEKWDISMSKEEFQEKFARQYQWIEPDEEYDPTKAWAYFPDITNPDFHELILDLAKKQIDSGADAIWIDMLFMQADYLAKLTNNVNHPGVKDSFETSSKIIDEIHEYGHSNGRYIYVGTWASCTKYPYPQPNLDFVTVTPSSEEVYSMELDDEKWDIRIQEIRKKLRDIPIFVFMDLGLGGLPLTIFGQNLNKETQSEFLKTTDEFFQKKGLIFIYPVHGGWFGNNPEILAFGKYPIYDSLAPEFQTYETIKELAQNKSKAEVGDG